MGVGRSTCTSHASDFSFVSWVVQGGEGGLMIQEYSEDILIEVLRLAYL